MLLKQEFKTHEGAMKRARFENVHSGTCSYNVVRCVDGVPDAQPFDRERWAAYTWRLERTHFPRRAS
jgi:hypothetical protein